MSNPQFIEVRGARENKLQNISLDIPKHQITVFPAYLPGFPAHLPGGSA